MKKQNRRFILGILEVVVGYHFATNCNWKTESKFTMVLNIIIVIAYTYIAITGIKRIYKTV